jgi:hypothetical protein
MTALTEFFFRYPDRARSSWSIVNWWESRRLAYNLSVGTAGVISIGTIEIFQLLPPHSMLLPIPWQAVAVYAVLANICYSLGPLAELGIRRLWGEELEPVGPALFRYGFAFSIGLTLLPAGLAPLEWVARLGRLIF